MSSLQLVLHIVFLVIATVNNFITIHTRYIKQLLSLSNYPHDMHIKISQLQILLLQLQHLLLLQQPKNNYFHTFKVFFGVFI